MRTKMAVTVAVFLMAGVLLLPQISAARRQTVLGSLSVTLAGGAALTDQVVGVAIISNPGFEKNVNQQLPPYRIPVFIDADEADAAGPGVPHIIARNVETTVFLTNNTGAALDIEIRLRNAEGATLGTLALTLPPNGTRAVGVSDLLP